jgi:hypothetical protein
MDIVYDLYAQKLLEDPSQADRPQAEVMKEIIQTHGRAASEHFSKDVNTDE